MHNEAAKIKRVMVHLGHFGTVGFERETEVWAPKVIQLLRDVVLQVPERKKDKSEQKIEKRIRLKRCILTALDPHSLYSVYSWGPVTPVQSEHPIQSYVRRPRKREKNLGALSAASTMLSMTFTCLLRNHHVGCREKPKQPIWVF